MHWLLHLLVDAVLIAGLAAAYKAYQEHRRKQSEYARVQLYEDADKPCVPAPFSPASARGSNTCSTPPSRPLPSAWQHHLTSRARCQPRTPSACCPPASVCGGTPVGGWADPDDRDDDELTSIAAGQEESALRLIRHSYLRTLCPGQAALRTQEAGTYVTAARLGSREVSPPPMPFIYGAACLR